MELHRLLIVSCSSSVSSSPSDFHF